MDALQKALVTLSLVIVITALNTITARADSFNPGAKVNSHLSTGKPGQSCNSWKDNGWIIEIDNYVSNAPDGTDDPAVYNAYVTQGYSDYVSDFNHYFTQYAGTCKVAPAEMPELQIPMP